MKTLITVIIIFIIGVGGFLVLRSGNVKEANNTLSGEGEIVSEDNKQVEDSQFDKIPDLTFEDYEGNILHLNDLKGKPLVINSWAVWCPFCRAELNDFALLQEEFGDEIAVVAINRRESLEEAKGFTDEIEVTDKMIFLLDPKDAFYKNIGGFSMPETIFADADGNIKVHKRGLMALDEMRQKVNLILVE